jgi:hypothetical protein
MPRSWWSAKAVGVLPEGLVTDSSAPAKTGPGTRLKERGAEMKLLYAAAIMSAGLPATAGAREVQVMSFTPAEPLEAPAQSAVGQSMLQMFDGAPVRPLEAAGTPTIEQRRPTDGLAIPGWMRGRSQPRMVVPVMPAVAQGCTFEPYRPIPGLVKETQDQRAFHYQAMASAACAAGVPTHLFDALIIQESQYSIAARSVKGAIGLTQLMPETARRLGVLNPWDAADNLRGGARYLRSQLDEFQRYDLALGAYNAGPGRIRQYHGLPPFRETLNYVTRILGNVRRSIVSRQASIMMAGQGPQTPAPLPASRMAMVVPY